MLRKEFGEKYDISVNLVSLPFFDNSFGAHVAVKVVEEAYVNGPSARDDFIQCLFENREQFINSATEERSMLDVRKIFARIAVKNKFFDHEGIFVGYLRDWPGSIDKAWEEQKQAIALNVTECPTHVLRHTIIAQGPKALDLAIPDFNKLLTPANL